MHTEARQYIETQIARQDLDRAESVLEIGGVDINGGVRDLLPAARWYVSIDPAPGPNVDYEVRARDFDPAPWGDFDLVVCTEVLEHVEQPAEVIACAWRSLRSGGTLLLTCASTGRKPHGARGAEHPAAGEWYRNVSPADLRDLLYAWRIVDLDYLETPGDVRCVAVKP